MNEDAFGEILRELGEIKVSLDHTRSDIADIKSDIRDIREEKSAMDDRIRELEQYQAECRGTSGTLKSAINGFAMLIAGIVSAAVSAIVTWMSK